MIQVGLEHHLSDAALGSRCQLSINKNFLMVRVSQIKSISERH